MKHLSRHTHKRKSRELRKVVGEPDFFVVSMYIFTVPRHFAVSEISIMQRDKWLKVGSAPAFSRQALWVRIQTFLKNHKWATLAEEWQRHSSQPKNVQKNLIDPDLNNFHLRRYKWSLSYVIVGNIFGQVRLCTVQIFRFFEFVERSTLGSITYGLWKRAGIGKSKCWFPECVALFITFSPTYFIIFTSRQFPYRLADLKTEYRSSRHNSIAGKSPAERHAPPAKMATRTNGESHLSLQRLNFKTRKKKKKKRLAAKKYGIKSDNEDFDEDDYEDENSGGDGSPVKSLAGRLLKRERRSLDSAGSSEHSSSEDGNKRKGKRQGC